MREFAFAICALFAFLLPIGFYCVILGSINRRGRPCLVSGAWDTVGLLFALSGFFLATAPMLISEFYVRAFVVDGHEDFYTLSLSHWVVWVVYFLLLISGGGLMITWRAHKTMIYNVDAELFPRALDQALVHAGLSATSSMGRLVLKPSVHDGESAAVPTPSHAELEVENFASMCHITLHWHNYTADVRQRFEQELDRALEPAAPLDNPTTGWLLNVSGMIFGALVMVVATLVVLTIFAKR